MARPITPRAGSGRRPLPANERKQRYALWIPPALRERLQEQTRVGETLGHTIIRLVEQALGDMPRQ